MKAYYHALLQNYLNKKNLKRSLLRERILDEIIQLNQHFTIEFLALALQKKQCKAGQATIYRAVKLFCACEICHPLTLQDGTVQYELVSPTHHDHLVCLKCGCCVEFYNPKMEGLQEKIAHLYGFKLIKHQLDMYGFCAKCQKENLSL